MLHSQWLLHSQWMKNWTREVWSVTFHVASVGHYYNSLQVCLSQKGGTLAAFCLHLDYSCASRHVLIYRHYGFWLIHTLCLFVINPQNYIDSTGYAFNLHELVDIFIWMFVLIFLLTFALSMQVLVQRNNFLLADNRRSQSALLNLPLRGSEWNYIQESVEYWSLSVPKQHI